MAVTDDIEEFISQGRTDLVRFAALQLRDQALAEDVVQDTFVAALQKAGQFSGRGSIKSWVFAILKRKIIDALRAHRRYAPLGDTAEEADERLEGLFNARGYWQKAHRPGRWSDPEDSLEQQQFWRIFELCLDGLPERTAQVFSMRELLGLETEEICSELAISHANCWVILHRARMGLRLCLDQRWFAHPA
jgi:RNA polymerase sigma-70 factor (ECF subfamily)